MTVLRLLTELDALLDTRLGVLEGISVEAATAVAQNPAYYTRSVDNFESLCDVPHAVWTYAWTKRSVKDLRVSQVTPIAAMLHYQLLELERKLALDPTLSGIELEVNCFPYQLSSEEKTVFALSIAQTIGRKTPIRMIYVPWNEMNPLHVRSYYSGLVLYNHNDWLKHNHTALIRIGLPQVTLVAPKLYYQPISANDESRLEGDKEINVWKMLTTMYAEVVGLEFLDVVNYCNALGGQLLVERGLLTV